MIKRSRVIKDKIFSHCVRFFGFLVLITFATIILHIFYNAAPVLFTPSFEPNLKSSSMRANIFKRIGNEWLSFDVNECRIYVSRLGANDKKTEQDQYVVNNVSKHCPIQIFDVNSNNGHFVAVLDDTNYLSIFDVGEYHKVSFKPLLRLDATSHDLMSSNPKLSISSDQQQLIISLNSSDGLVVESFHLTTHQSVSLPIATSHKGLLPMFSDSIFVGYDSHTIYVYDRSVRRIQSIDFERQIAFVYVMRSGRELIVLDESGHLHKYSIVNQAGQFSLFFNYRVELDVLLTSMPEPLASKIVGLHDESQHGTLLLVTNQGNLHLINAVSGQHLNSHDVLTNAQYSYYANNSLLIVNNQTIFEYIASNMQGMLTFDILFHKQSYAGYTEESYVWQSAASSNQQIAKYSLVPLIIGSLKASFLALLVAVPLSFGSAVYTAYFAPSRVRNIIKPCIEMLEAFPSVVIGFIAVVWLLPMTNFNLAAILLLLMVSPALIFVTAFLHMHLHRFSLPKSLERMRLLIAVGIFFLFLTVVFQVIVIATHAITQNQYEVLADIALPKTAIIVAVALGLAITPTIYTLIDDALYEVPDGVKQASFALGANDVQTLVHVVLMVALPSIISAIMLGFGRAFGETMIVLMITGNTPIPEWDLFAGLRTLTANITIEMPTAQLDSNLYHVLFVTAALLFAFTFIINTIASFLKRRIRRVY